MKRKHVYEFGLALYRKVNDFGLHRVISKITTQDQEIMLTKLGGRSVKDAMDRIEFNLQYNGDVPIIETYRFMDL